MQNTIKNPYSQNLYKKHDINKIKISFKNKLKNKFNFPEEYCIIDTESQEYTVAIDFLNKKKINYINDKKEQLIWILEHEKVYTTGRLFNKSDILNETNIPIIHSNRGGATTFHSRGQLIIYFVYDFKSNIAKINGIDNLNIFIITVSNIIIDIINEYLVLNNINIKNKIKIFNNFDNCYGVYVKYNDVVYKIAFFGFHISQNVLTHGISFNFNNDLREFKNIIPCGLQNIELISLDILLKKLLFENN